MESVMKKLLSASLAAGLLLALTANDSVAGATAEHMDFYKEAVQANANAIEAHQACVPANGAQILAGMASPDDLVKICGHR
jgi:hypothetical protein